MRVVAIDYGTRRMGMAVSDPDGSMALALPVFVRQGDEGDVDRMADRLREQGAERIVLGLPLNMDGTEGDSARQVRAFGTHLQARSGLAVEYVDERLTSEEAQDRLRGLPLSREKRRDHANTVAAQIILEAYLSRKKGEKS